MRHTERLSQPDAEVVSKSVLAIMARYPRHQYVYVSIYSNNPTLEFVSNLNASKMADGITGYSYYSIDDIKSDVIIPEWKSGVIVVNVLSCNIESEIAVIRLNVQYDYRVITEWDFTLRRSCDEKWTMHSIGSSGTITVRQ